MKNDLSFDHIAKDILKNKKFQKISNETHHGITRMEHTMRVARNVYKISKKLRLDYESATRAAILHDFFINNDCDTNHAFVQGIIHPEVALANAKKEFGVNAIEENAIVAHMFPLSKTIPKYKESWVLTLVDKVIAIYEMACYKFSYTKVTSKLSWTLSLTGIFLFNVLTIGRK